MTQEELVSELYQFDEALFKSLDTVTLSRWELAKSSPHVSKQVRIIKYFQTKNKLIFPCFEETEPEVIEKNICKSGIDNLLGKSKAFILNFPSSISVDELTVHQLRGSEMIDEIIQISLDLNKEFSYNHSLISAEQLKTWAFFPHSLFLTCEYKKQFFGLLFSLRLKPEVFGDLMDFKINESELTIKDFADTNEMGCDLILSFFAMNNKAATLLSIRYFAYLIATQQKIREVGAMSMKEDAIKLMENIHLHHYKSKAYGPSLQRHSYRAPLSDVLINENVVRMVLHREDCGSET